MACSFGRKFGRFPRMTSKGRVSHRCRRRQHSPGSHGRPQPACAAAVSRVRKVGANRWWPIRPQSGYVRSTVPTPGSPDRIAREDRAMPFPVRIRRLYSATSRGRAACRTSRAAIAPVGRLHHGSLPAETTGPLSRDDLDAAPALTSAVAKPRGVLADAGTGGDRLRRNPTPLLQRYSSNVGSASPTPGPQDLDRRGRGPDRPQSRFCRRPGGRHRDRAGGHGRDRRSP